MPASVIVSRAMTDASGIHPPLAGFGLHRSNDAAPAGQLNVPALSETTDENR
jgi:hypothetical protein